MFGLSAMTTLLILLFIFYFVFAYGIWSDFCREDAVDSKLDLTSFWGRYVILPLWVICAPIIILVPSRIKNAPPKKEKPSEDDDDDYDDEDEGEKS